jgi:hypothetical protein
MLVLGLGARAKLIRHRLLSDCYHGKKKLVKVLKALAELKDLSLGDLLEGIVLHAFEGKAPFSPETLKEVEQFRKIYGLTLRAADSHRLKERRR